MSDRSDEIFESDKHFVRRKIVLSDKVFREEEKNESGTEELNLLLYY